MQYRLRALLLAVMALTTIAPSTKPSGPESGGEWGDPVIGCRLRTVSPPKEVSAGDALDVKVEVRNDGDSAIMFSRLGSGYTEDCVEIGAVTDRVDILADWRQNPEAPKTRYARNGTGTQLVFMRIAPFPEY